MANKKHTYTVELPCKIGDDIWWIDEDGPTVECEKHGVRGIAIMPDGIRVITEIGMEKIGVDNCYLTREDAEKALAAYSVRI